MKKTYRGRDENKHCHNKGCKRRVHAHFGRLAYCSTHYSSEWRQHLVAENGLQRALISFMELALRVKVKDTKIKYVLNELNEIDLEAQEKEGPVEKLKVLVSKGIVWSDFMGIESPI